MLPVEQPQTPERRRSRRETTVHSTKASWQIEQQQQQQQPKKKQHQRPQKKRRITYKPAVTIIKRKSQQCPEEEEEEKDQGVTTRKKSSSLASPMMMIRSRSTPTRRSAPPSLTAAAVERRCSARNRSTIQLLYDLASIICRRQHQEDPPRVVFITGAGLSVDSGIRPFRTSTASSSRSSHVHDDPYSHHHQHYQHRHVHSEQTTTTLQKKRTNHILQAGIWDEVIWTTATRVAFRKDPVRWYTQFWNVYFGDTAAAAAASNTTTTKPKYQPNIGHYVMDCLLAEFQNVYQITQNIDGLQQTTASPRNKKQLIEVHGRCGLYKCCPPAEEEEDEDETDTDDQDDGDDDDDDDDDGPAESKHRKRHRPVRIGSHTASRRLLNRSTAMNQNTCPYQYLFSLTSEQVIPRTVNLATPKAPAPPPTTKTPTRATNTTNEEPERVVTVPTCPHCHHIVMPQALLFDESYHDHKYYQYELVEEWIQNANVIVLVGTSCTVQLTQQTLKYAVQQAIPIYNLNLHPLTVSSQVGTAATTSGSIQNILGPASETLPLLLAECRSIREAQNAKVHHERNNK